VSVEEVHLHRGAATRAIHVTNSATESGVSVA
jgi:hypothetical protein